MIKQREDANLTLRKDTVADMINKKRFMNLGIQNKTSNLIINPSQLNLTQEKVSYYNNLNQVK